MSIQLMSEVWNSDLPAGPKFVLMCLADSANNMGECFPGIATLSRKCSMTERTVQRNLRWLFDNSLIQEYWDFTDRLRTKRVRHFRLLISGIPKRPEPDYSSCTPELRASVILHFGQTCVYCKRAGDATNGPDGTAWHIDRIIPGSRGGKYTGDNVTLSCKPCNSSKGANLAPQETKSLGAKLDAQGCQPRQKQGAELAPESKEGITKETRRAIVNRLQQDRIRTLSRILREEKNLIPAERARIEGLLAAEQQGASP